MSFNFGNTTFGANTSSFGSTVNKTTGFGTAFGATTSAAPTFGLGAPATSTGFGNFGTTPAASTGFGGFGTTATTGTSSFGGFSGFGQTTAPTTGFGTTPAAPTSGFAFGAATSAPSTGFSFGGPTNTTTSTGFGGFGGFGTATSNPGTSLFGGGLGQTTNTGFGGFGTNFGAKPTTSFGLGNTTFGQTPGQTFGQPQQTFQPQPVDPSLALYNSIFNCQVFGDERDSILGRWNLLQALWGVGKGFYSQQAPAVEYTMKNPFCRFKAVAYSERPKHENRDGLVALVFNKKESEIRPLESQIVSNLVTILGNKPHLSPSVERIRALSDTKTLVVICVQEKTATGVRKIPANELGVYLLQPTPKQQLTGLQVENVYPHVEVATEQLREYLDVPPAGIDAQVWQQAQEDNPLPDRLIPVPLVGFGEVRWRMKCQENEAGLQQTFLNNMSESMSELQRKKTTTLANISEYKSRLVELQHRILKLLVLQEKSRKMGMSLLPAEENLNSRLEALTTALNAPKFKNRLAQLTEGVKSLTDSNKEPLRYKMDPSVVSQIKPFLSMEQQGMCHVIETIQSDMSEMKIIKDGMLRLVQGHL